MIGLLALLVVLLLIALAWVISGWLTLWLKNKKELRVVLRLLIVPLLFFLLFIDEFLGKQQFQALCEKNATTIRIDAAKAKGKTVKLEVDPSNEALSGFWLPIYHSHLSYRDVNTGEEIAQFDRYRAKGGWFNHLQPFGSFNSHNPVTFEHSVCDPENSASFPQEYGLTVIN